LILARLQFSPNFPEAEFSALSATIVASFAAFSTRGSPALFLLERPSFVAIVRKGIPNFKQELAQALPTILEKN
jgi:hypothetical protein